MTIKDLYPRNTICEGDNLIYLRSFPDESFDMIYGDPPYNSKRNYAAPAGTAAEGTAFKDFWSWSDISEELFYELNIKYPELAQFLSQVDKVHSKGMKAYCVMMAARLIEIHRVLKKTGTVYIHCDHTAVSYLKPIMDFIFKIKNFRNQIIWQRTEGNKRTTKNLPNNCDYILRYTKTDNFIWNRQHASLPPDEDFLKKFNKNDNDGKGLYKLLDFNYPKAYENDGTRSWRTYDILGITDIWRWDKDRALEGIKNGTVIRRNNTIYYKIYLSDSYGKQLSNLWTDISNIKTNMPESTGFKTQKPRKLIQRLILLSTNIGDSIFDPFCGSGTTLIEAQNTGRHCIGSDVGSRSVEFVEKRMVDELGIFLTEDTKPDLVRIPRTFERQIILPIKKPKTKKIKKQPRNTKEYQQHKPKLYLNQEGRCNGCDIFCVPQHLTVDHEDGNYSNNEFDNLQLLCSNCNSIKGNRPMSYLKKRIKEFQNDPDVLYV